MTWKIGMTVIYLNEQGGHFENYHICEDFDDCFRVLNKAEINGWEIDCVQMQRELVLL